jgi:hypothetical protein
MSPGLFNCKVHLLFPLVLIKILWRDALILCKYFVSSQTSNALIIYISMFPWFSILFNEFFFFCYYHYLLRCSNCTKCDHWESCQPGSCILFTCIHHFSSTSCFLAPQDSPGFSTMSHFPTLELVTSPRCPGSHRECCLKPSSGS